MARLLSLVGFGHPEVLADPLPVTAHLSLELLQNSGASLLGSLSRTSLFLHFVDVIWHVCELHRGLPAFVEEASHVELPHVWILAEELLLPPDVIFGLEGV